MERQKQEEEESQIQVSPCTSGRRSSSSSSEYNSTSPEFEFWKVRNPQPNLLSADELFVDGILLPLHLLHLPPQLPPPPNSSSSSPPHPPLPLPSTSPSILLTPPPPSPDSTPINALTSLSKIWNKFYLFNPKSHHHHKLQNNHPLHQPYNDKDKVKLKEKEKGKKKRDHRKCQTEATSSSSSAPELNINIWPFSRSRSAGNNGTRPRMSSSSSATRKVSSAPCSRSNSSGESKSRKWPVSPGRSAGGLHLGRSSPVWQVRRSPASSYPPRPMGEKMMSGSRREFTESRRGKSRTGSGSGGKANKVLNINVPMCIESDEQHLSCRRSHVNGPINGGNSSNGGNAFNIRSLFTKKVH